MKPQSVSFTEPVLCHYDFNLEKSWFVYFDITNKLTGETRRVQKRGGLEGGSNNYWKTKDERLRAGNALKKYWVEMLDFGWHPFEKTGEQLIYPTTPFNDALDFALSKCKVAKKTMQGYSGTVDFCKAAAKKLGYDHRPVKDIERTHIRLILEQVQKERDWSNHAYNKNLGYLAAVLSQLEQWDVIKFNPAHRIKCLPVTETQKYVPLTDEEKETIREHLFVHHYRFFVYLMVIYHTGIRSKEVLALRIKDVDLKNDVISILPDLESENSKTKNIRKVPVNNHLKLFLKQLQLHEYKGDYYVFGSPYESGKGNKGSSKGRKSGALHPDYFKPSSVMIKRDTVTRLWKRIVIDDEGIGIKKHQYALKHTGADAKILAGIDLDALRELYGHSSKFMTEKYARKVKVENPLKLTT